MDAFWKLLRELNVERCEKHFHTCGSWSLQEWGIAVFGELGEACNEIKKIIRGDGNKSRLAAELADVVIYLDLLAYRAGFLIACVPDVAIDALNERYPLPTGKTPVEVPTAKEVGSALARAARKLGDLDYEPSAYFRSVEVLFVALPAVWQGFQLAGVLPERAIREKFDEVSRRVGYPPSLAARGASAAVA